MRRLLLLGLVLLAGLATLHADNRPDLEKQLRQDYEGKVLILRTFYDGPELRFDSAGNKLQGGDPGPWTVDAQVRIDKVRLSGKELQIDGQRIFLAYEEKTRQFEDVFSWIDAHDQKSRKQSRDELHKREKIRIVCELPPAGVTAEALKAAMQKIFLAPGENLADFVPPYWAAIVRSLYGGSAPAATSGGGGALRVRDGVKPPRLLHQPDPEYSDVARAARFQGTMLLTVIVSPEGEVSEVRIDKPLGLGLDENSVAAVRAWKFQPALKDGQPVAVVMQVENTFHLY